MDFEKLDEEQLASHLRSFYATAVTKKDGRPFSKSGMINLRSGLNRHLRLPPHNRTLNLMRDREFQGANQVFLGKIRLNKQDGHDTSKARPSISEADLQKLYQNYFADIESNTQILQHKVFFDLLYHLGRRGKEGLRSLSRDSFAIKNGPNDSRYLEITFNEVTKKNQGDRMSTSTDALHNNHAIISEQKGDKMCLSFSKNLVKTEEGSTKFLWGSTPWAPCSKQSVSMPN